MAELAGRWDATMESGREVELPIASGLGNPA
jgi:hypothetical protein